MRNTLMALLALVVIALAGAQARADEVFIAGFTSGCFGVGCTPTATATGAGGSLIFNNSTFQGTTSNGIRTLGGNPNPLANFNNLGSLQLIGTPNLDINTTFRLQVTLTAPQGMVGPNSGILTASITGSVRGDDQGGVIVEFAPFSSVFFFWFDDICEPDPTGGVPGQQTTCGMGNFSLRPNNTAIDPGQVVSITGQIRNAQQHLVPEPMTMILFGTGLAGVAAKMRRRKVTPRE